MLYEIRNVVKVVIYGIVKMKVKELIEELKKLEQERYVYARVLFSDCRGIVFAPKRVDISPDGRIVLEIETS